MTPSSALPSSRNLVPRSSALTAKLGRALVVVTVAAWAYGVVGGFRNAVFYLTLVGMAAALAGVVQPTLGLMGVGMLCTLDSAARVYILTGGLFRWNTINFILLLVALLFARRLFTVRAAPAIAALLLLLYLLLGLAFSADLVHGVQHLSGLVGFFGLLVYALRGGTAQGWYWTAIVCGILGACGGFVFNLQKSDLPFINPNAWSYFPVTAILTTCIALSFRSRPRGSLLVVLAAVNGAWVFLSGSRGAILITVLCAAYIALVAKGVGSRVLLIGGVLVAIGLTLQFASQSDYARKRVEKLLTMNEPLANRTSGRSELMLGAWYIFVDHPFGVGTGGFTRAWERMTFVPGMSYFEIGEDMAAHSAWAKVLAENGFIGFLLLATFVGSFAYLGWKRRPEGLFPIGAFTTLVLAAAFTNTEFQSKGLWLLSAATVVILSRSRPSVGRTGDLRGSSPARAVPRMSARRVG